MSEPQIPPEKWDAAVVPTWTRADNVALAAIEYGFTLQPWQFDTIARHFPIEEQP